MVTTPDLRPGSDPGELTAAEFLIWAGQRLDPDSTLYNMAVALEVEGDLDPDDLAAALGRVVAADDVLRTTYPDRGGRPTRQILDAVERGLDVLDVPASDVTDDEVYDRLTRRARRRLPLHEPLFDACVVRRGADRSVLFLNQHHIAMDAWSVGVFFARWGAEYLRVRDELPPRPAHPSYSDHVAREHEARASAGGRAALAHWASDASTARNVHLPLQFYGFEVTGRGRVVHRHVDFGRERGERLARIASRAPFRGLTTEQSRYQVFATLLLAWHHRISDRADVSIGSPWHNRVSADARRSLGVFTELFPLRTQVAEDETFASLGAKVARTLMENMRHVSPGASLAPAARGYPVVLNYITAKVPEFAGWPSRTRWIRPEFVDPDHAARLHVHDFDGEGSPRVDFDLAEAVFDEPAREWAGRHLLRLFDAMVDDPDRAIAEVPLTDESESGHCSPTGASVAPPPLVRASFREVAEARSEDIAVVDGADRRTYADLLAMSSTIASRLLESGMEPGDVVGVALGPSADLVVALLGVMEAGGAFLPLDPIHPDPRLTFMCEESGATRVVCGSDIAERVREWGATPITITGGSHVPGRSAPQTSFTTESAPSIGRGNLAYVLYTSGSTGRPKGVEVAHGSLAEYVHWARRVYVGEERLRFPLFTSPAFDMTLTSIFVPLVSGGTIVVYRDAPDGAGLLVRRVFEDEEVDLVKLTPSHLALVRDMDLTNSGIGRLIVGGEDLKSHVARAAWSAFGGDIEIFNEYGPTEATVGCMIHRWDPDTDTDGSVPIGRPADNVGIHVLDGYGNPVPRGVRGEICISGPRVARGYRARPEETRRAFSRRPGPDEAALYRTGDMGRWTPAGTVDFLGRADDQVKVRGVRIELGEIEAALAHHPAVHEQVAVVIRGGARNDETCVRCGLQRSHPEAQLDPEGVCAPCRRFEKDRERIASYFGDFGELEGELRRAREQADGPHDTIMLYSGGKDSTYALCRIVDMGARPLVFMLDNGFISDEAKRNVRKVVDQLGLELVIGRTPSMNEVFAESLERFSNVCDGCFKVIYTLALNLAVDRGIPAIVTGLSRGQIFETRLADLYRRGIFDREEVDRTIHEARKIYHRMDDAVSRTMDVGVFRDDRALDAIRFIDFYRYHEVELDDLYAYLRERTPWIRPGDTGRSTNCLINEAGIHVHRTERGFHNYTLPYSWDVRLGHKDRDAALDELDDDIDPARVRRMLDEVGYRERPAPDSVSRLVAYYTSDEELPDAELRGVLGDRLPREMIPSRFVRLDRLPLTSHGKVDRAALEPPGDERPRLETVYVAPSSPREETLVEVWSDVLGLQSIGVRDDFFELGGDSMQCLQIVSAAQDLDIVIAPRDLFANPTVESLARVARTGKRAAAPRAASATASELSELGREFGG